ncbi:GntR family transcriptional regulator (plasmid) [Streptomyces griseobrunneus]
MPQIDYPVNSAEASAPLSLPPLREAVSRTGRVRDALRQAILEGVLPPGKALVERELAEMYGVSKTPVREALKQLRSTGLVEINAYQGVSVRRPDNRLVQELYTARPNTADLGDFLASAGCFGGWDECDGPGGWLGWVAVVGVLEVPVAHLAFDDTGVGALSAGWEESFQQLTGGVGHGSAES